MDLTNAKELLERYYEGETTRNEELELRSFLAGYNGDDSSLVQAKQMFNAFSEASIQASDLQFEQINQSPKERMMRWVQWSGAVAAAFLVPIILTFWLKSAPHPVAYAYVNGKPVFNKEQAFQDTQKALLALSGNMEKGTGPLKQIQVINKPVELLTLKK
jgi:hypothetical protein